MAGAGAGAGAEIRDERGAGVGAENKQFWLRNTALKGHYSETKFSGVLYSLQYIHKKINNIDI